MNRDTQENDFISKSESFLRYLKRLEHSWQSISMTDIINDAGGVDNVAIICADVTKAFISTGRLASPRVATIVPPIVELFKLAYSSGIRHFVLPQDAHPADSPEFEAYGPHAIPGTEEAETVPELKELPFSSEYTIIPKQNLNPGIDTEFPAWLDAHSNIRQFIVVGDCTDLCIYQTTTYLRLRANQFKLNYEITVPENCVDTFETEFVLARELGAMPHNADLMHLIFLYHMQLNGIQIVRNINR